MFQVNQLVTPVDKEKVLNDTLLNTASKNILNECNAIGMVTQVQNDLNYVTYFSNSGDRLTQVYKNDEIKAV